MAQVYYDAEKGQYYTRGIDSPNPLGSISMITGGNFLPHLNRNYIGDPASTSKESQVTNMLARAQNAYNQSLTSNPMNPAVLFPSLGSVNPMTPNISDLYRNVLGRTPEAEGANYWARDFGSSIDPQEYQTFLNAAQPEMAQRNLPATTYNPFAQQSNPFAGSSGAGRFMGNTQGLLTNNTTT